MHARGACTLTRTEYLILCTAVQQSLCCAALCCRSTPYMRMCQLLLIQTDLGTPHARARVLRQLAGAYSRPLVLSRGG